MPHATQTGEKAQLLTRIVGLSIIYPMNLIEKEVARSELEKLAKERFGDLVKAVVDIKRNVMIVGGDLHADEELELLENGSEQKDLWGINLYPAKAGEEFIEYDSIINLRPSQGNRSRSVVDPEIRKQIQRIVSALVRDS